MDKALKLKTHSGILIDIPMADFPVSVTGTFLNGEGVWVERHFTWKISYHRDEKTYEKQLDKPKGSQLEMIAWLCLLPILEKTIILFI